MWVNIEKNQEPIKGSLPYLALESTLSSVEKQINWTPPSVRRANQNRAMTIIASPTCTRSGWGERLDDSSDESSDTVDVSSSEKSASSDSESGQSKDLATAVERGNPRKEILLQLRRLHSLERKAKLAIFFTVRGLLNRNMIVFAGRSHSENRSTRELGVDSRN